MTYYIAAIAGDYTYRRLETLPGATLDAAMRELIRWSTKRVCAVILRDGATGKRYSVADAMRHHKLGFVDWWYPAKWLAKEAA